MFFFSLITLITILMLTPLKAEAQANPYKIRIEGNFDLGFEFRRDADAEFDDRTLGFDHAFTHKTKPYFALKSASHRAEFRAYAYPAPPIEVYAKVFFNNQTFKNDNNNFFTFNDPDFLLGEAHTKLRVTRGSGDHERGLESYFFYREGRLSVGDPILSIAFDDARNDKISGRNGIATNVWLPRGFYTFPKGRWMGELNFQNIGQFDDERNASGENNDAFAGKIRHEYKVDTELNLAAEALWAHKTFSASNVARSHNDVFGLDFTAAWKTTNFAIQYHPVSVSQTVDANTPGNDALGVDLNSLVLLNRPKTGRVGFNAFYNRFGRNYQNFVGRQRDNEDVAHEIIDGLHIKTKASIDQNMGADLYWDIPKYQANLTYRRRDRHADGFQQEFEVRDFAGGTVDPITGIFTPGQSGSIRRITIPGEQRDFWFSRSDELDLNVKLVKGFSARVLYNRTRFGLEDALYDFDANRFLRFENKISQNRYAYLKMDRPKGSLKIDYRNLQRRTVVQQIAGFEAFYKITSKMNFLLRGGQMWIQRPDQLYTITEKPFDIGTLFSNIPNVLQSGDHINTSLVEPFFKRKTLFAQITYKPTDNSQFFLEYGQGFHLDNDLSLDGDFLAPSRRTDARIFTKLEIWF